ncbi:MAG: putative ABC transporter permease, partial [Lachnospiraceae bacterium]|nr:putative ABC transporter permease [Lachnospiraceae bacterium]
YLAMICFISFLGFCQENIWMMLRKGYIDNRNMNLPFLLGYGVLVTGIYFIMGVPESNHIGIYFVITFVVVSVGEILLGEIVERLCGIYYWDYTALPFHITRYTSVFTSMGFSFIITGFMRKLFIPIMDILHGEMNLNRSIVVCILMSLLIIDFIYSFGYMIKHKNFYNKWKKEIRFFQNSKISRKGDPSELW